MLSGIRPRLSAAARAGNRTRRSFAGLTPLGRYGAFKYNNQDHSILMGILAAENLLEGRGHDLWAVNTDYETYGDDTRITENGLVEEPVPA